MTASARSRRSGSCSAPRLRGPRRSGDTPPMPGRSGARLLPRAPSSRSRRWWPRRHDRRSAADLRFILGRMLEVTGERLLPEQQRGELVHAQHLARYRFASQLAEGRRVLDAACGEGYGTAMLAAAGAGSVVGLDIDKPTVEHARAKYGLEFEHADVGELPFEDGSFDLVVSFETLEHVPDAARAISEFRRVLADGGVLVASTPNSDRYLVDNEFHAREFTQDEFGDLLAPHFSDVALFYQQDWLTSAVMGERQLGQSDGERSLDLDVSKVAGHEPGDQLFTIAVCGPRDASLSDTAVVTAIFEAQKLNEWVK